MAEQQRFSINFLGDVMLGRLIDQLFKTSVNEPQEASIIQSFVRKHPHLHDYSHSSPWGSTLPLLKSSHLNIINLETSVTTNDKKWPDKVFNYRMHPANITALPAAKIDYASLANNHTLDFREAGLVETIDALKKADIAFAGVGGDLHEARRPAVLSLPRHESASTSLQTPCKVLVWSASDHPDDWDRPRMFNLIDYSARTRTMLKSMVEEGSQNTLHDDRPMLKVFSVHWGPNYAWEPSEEIRSLAHFLIDECGIDVIHGHSSHHIQGVEIYKSKLIMYGCGDFVDDYALVAGYRNDLSAVWRLNVHKCREAVGLETLEVFPTRIKQFQTEHLVAPDPDHEWIRDRFRVLSEYFGTEVPTRLGDDGQMTVQLR